MTAIAYQQLALDWHPDNRRDRDFNILAITIIVLMLVAGFILSSIEVPKQEVRAVNKVPERIAQFVMQREKAKPKVVKPEPKPKPPPIIKSLKRKKVEQKPLTKIEKKARKKAASSGLLALGNELADLMDTSSISAMVNHGGKMRSSSNKAMKTAAALDDSMLTTGIGEGSGGVDQSQYISKVSTTTKLAAQELTEIRDSLSSSRQRAKDKSRKDSDGPMTRTEEDISMVFDRNKGKLYSLYSRARRTNPGLKGRIVLEIIIAETGRVVSVEIVSSELNDATLERRIVSRIKQFQFGVSNAKSFKVTYPIEFLPS